MLSSMKNSGKRNWSVYVLRCGDGTLYTGIAKDVETRLKQHGSGKGAAYTRTHLPVELVYQESRYTRSQALVREAAVKRLPRSRKERLILSKPVIKASVPALTDTEL
jgi:predicted GIY-YIG superfamily endonuclease